MTQAVASELVATCEALHNPRWMRPLARAIQRSHGSVRFRAIRQRPVSEATAEKIRDLHRIHPVGVIIRGAL
jgi:hypothetical protein